VKFEAHLRHGRAQGADEIGSLQRIQNADGVRDAQTHKSGLLRGEREFHQEPAVSARRVLCADGQKLEGAAKFGGQFSQRPEYPFMILLPRAQVDL
jgi:hypothetical protein